MTTTGERYRTTALIVLVSMGLGAAIAAVGSSSTFLENLGGAIIILGWFVLAPTYHFWLSRRSESESETNSESGARAGTGTAVGTRSETVADRPADDVPEAEDPLATLKHRYAAGDISEAEFERTLEQLLELEDLELDDFDTIGDASEGRVGSGARGRSTDSDSEFEYE